MTDTNTLKHLQNRIAKMEWCYEKELRKLKTDHDQLKARVWCPQGKDYFAYTLHECTQGESHSRRTINTPDVLCLSYMHYATG